MELTPEQKQKLVDLMKDENKIKAVVENLEKLNIELATVKKELSKNQQRKTELLSV